MQRIKMDSVRERRILASLINNTQFLSQASRVWDNSLITEDHYRIVSQWCLAYYDSYGKAPGNKIEMAYEGWADGNSDETTVRNVRAFLDSMEDVYEDPDETNLPALLDNLGKFLSKKKIQKLQREMELSVLYGNVKDAEEALVSYRKVEIGGETGTNPLDPTIWPDVFTTAPHSLIPFQEKSPLGKFFNRAMTRDALIAIQAPEKSGKSYLCLEFAIRGLMSRKKVAFFEVGDLSYGQLMLRFGVRFSGRPLWKQSSIMVPYRIEKDNTTDTGYYVERREVERKSVVSHRSVKSGLRRFCRRNGLSDQNQYLRVSVHPNNTCTVRQISSILDQWEQEHNFVADIIIVDYADILAQESKSTEKGRDQVNETWQALRRLSQERHTLVIVPTQAKSSAYEVGPDRLMSMKDFSEDKRKMSHVTGMIGMNQTPEEKEMGGMRLNWVVLRNSDFNPRRPLYIGTCFALSRAMCCAAL